jgi:hypothetical protein
MRGLAFLGARGGLTRGFWAVFAKNSLVVRTSLKRRWLLADLQPGLEVGQRGDGLVGAGAGGGFGAGQQEGLAKVGGVGGSDVRAAVADQDGLGQVEVEVLGGAEEHAGARFAVGVLALVDADAVVGVEGAVVDGVDGGVAGGELRAHPGHEGGEVFFGVETASDAGLVGDDDEFVAKADGGGGEREDAVNPTHVFDAVEEAGFVVDDAVAVQEEGFGHSG